MDSKGPDWLDAVKAALRGFSVYDDLRAALIEKGVPPQEIAFIHDANTDEQKAALNARLAEQLKADTPGDLALKIIQLAIHACQFPG